MEVLKIGDLVRLKSGGPPMTIKEYAPTGRTATEPKGPEPILSEDVVICTWFAGQTLQSGNFPLITLTPYTGAISKNE